MSDSDDDAAFASADEGEDTSKPSQPPKPETPKEAKVGKETETKAKKEEKKETPAAAPSQQTKGATGKGKKKGKQGKKHAQSTEKVSSKPVEEKKTEVTKPVDKKEPQSETSKEADVKVEKNNEEEKKESKEKEKDVSQERKVEEDNTGDVKQTLDVKKETKEGETLVKCPSGQNIQRESGQLDPKLALDQLVDDDDDEEEEKGDEKASSWGWGGFGSVMKVAQSSVTTFTSQVGEGFNTVMDTLENTLGAIPPEQLADLHLSESKKAEEGKEEELADGDKSGTEKAETKQAQKDTWQEKPADKEVTEQPHAAVADEGKKDQEEKKEGTEEPQASGGGWFSSWGMSSIKDAVAKTSNIVQSTSKNLVTGGIDVLETVGKKAYDFIEEHDPGIHRSKVLFERGNKPNLSHLLKEAKEEADQRAEMEKESEEARKAHFGYLFDEYQGISHLEALEILSNQCEKKVQTLLQSLPAETLASIKSELIEIKQIFEQENDDDNDDEEQEHEFVRVMTELLTDLHLGTAPDKINKVQEKIRKIITDFYIKQEQGEKVDPKEMHQNAIQSLAELTSKAMEQFHKAGELILIQKDSDKSFIERAKCLLSINRLLSTEVSILSTKFSNCLNKLGEDIEDDSSVKQMVTNIYLEASNSSTYIHDGFQLLLPCLQQGAIENTPGIKE